MTPLSGVTLALAAIAFWSTNAIVAKLAFSELKIAQIQLLQFAGAFLTFAVMRLASRRRPAASLRRGPVILAGIVGITATMVFQYLAFSYGPIAEVNLIAYSWPLMLAVLLVILGAAGRPLVTCALAMVGFAGAALIVDPFTPALGAGGFGWGHAAAIASALAMAAYSVIVARADVDQIDAHLIGSLAGVMIAGAMCLAAGTVWNPEPALQLMAIYLGVGPIGLGYFLWARAMATKQADQVAIIGFLTPVVSTVWLVTAGETLSQNAMFGSVLIIGASLLVGTLERRPARRREVGHGRA